MSILFTAALTFVVLLNLYYGNRALNSLASRELHATAMQHGNDIQAFIDVATNATNDMASITESMYEEGNPFTRVGLIAMIRGYLNNNNHFAGAGSGWEKNAFDNNDDNFKNTIGSNSAGLFIPYLIGSGSVDILTDIEISDWYTVPKLQKKQVVTDPYIYKVGNNDVLMTTSSSPVIVDNVFKGVITIDVALDVIVDKILNIKLYDSGYAFLATHDGTYITHPKAASLGTTSTTQSIKTQLEKGAFLEGQSYLELDETPNQEPLYLAYYPIKLGTSGETWFLIIVVPKAEVLQESTFIVSVGVLAAVATLLFSIVIVLKIVQSQMKPLVYMANAASIIAQGKLDYQINDNNFGGEMHQLSAALKSMIHSLTQNISEAQTQTDTAKKSSEEARIALGAVNEANDEMEAKRDIMISAASDLENIVSIIKAAVKGISTQVEHASNGAFDQASRIAITAQDIVSMNDGLLSVARNANMSAELSTNAKDEAFEGAQLTEKCKLGINLVRSESLTLKDRMSDLSLHANNINDIMIVISDIADQTNLLALNAAIEAARAGETGRGFAVVADEVRKLAEKTMSSTVDVGNAIKAIQESAEKNVQQVDSTVEKIQDVTIVAEQSGEALKRIVGMIDQADEEVRTIAFTSQEQSNTSSEIANSVSEVKNIAETTLTVMQESNKAIAELSTQTEHLSVLIQRMKQG